MMLAAIALGKRVLTWLAIVLAVTGMAHVACAQEKSKPEQPTVDDALLDDLDNELMEDVGGLDKPGAKPEHKQPGEAPAADGEHGGANPEQDPLGYISQEMRKVERLIPERGEQTHAEALQRRIVDDLTRLIEQAEQQRAQQQQSSGGKNQQQSQRQQVKQPQPAASKPSLSESNKPASDSTDRMGKAEQARPDPRVFQGMIKDTWGHLPDRDREQMRQLSPERFLPQYELLIERYYRRLAEEHAR
jgi:hypothetical protein